ncbi:MAG TPA: hypothetical protein PLW40_11185 [Syntrophales bacterium]|nr:hypothetical protein [Syntrophales bacterium]
MANFRGYKSVEEEIRKSNGAHEKYRAAKIVTALIFKKIKARAGDVPVIVFVADGLEPFYGDFRKISENEGFVFLKGIAAAVSEAHRKGEAVFVQDEGHWSPRGHEIAGLVLLDALKGHLPIFSPKKGRHDITYHKDGGA